MSGTQVKPASQSGGLPPVPELVLDVVELVVAPPPDVVLVLVALSLVVPWGPPGMPVLSKRQPPPRASEPASVARAPAPSIVHLRAPKLPPVRRTMTSPRADPDPDYPPHGKAHEAMNG